MGDLRAIVVRLGLAGVLCLPWHCSCARGPDEQPHEDDLAADRLAREKNLAWFRDAKLGLFIHWGPACLTGEEISWARWGPRPGLDPAQSGIPAEQYDQLYKQFNPTAFNADEWVALARAAGARYLVFTAKHHDGFSMFDTRWSDYNIMRSPFGRDVCAELADACHKAGLKLGWYYSPVDWYHPDYLHPRKHRRYITFMHRQLEELCSRYGKVTMLWFDVPGDYPYEWDTDRLLAELRRLQNGVLINDRLCASGDYVTVEHQTNRFQSDKPWENALTLGTQWSYKPGDQIRTLSECVGALVRTVGGDGNLVLNVGPTPTGRIEPAQAQRLREIGQWLKPIGESIYGTRGGPFRPGLWGASTHRDRCVYVHILNWIEPTIRLPAMDAKIVRSRLLTGGAVSVTQSEDGIEISVPPADRDTLDTVVVLELDRPAVGVSVSADGAD